MASRISRSSRRSRASFGRTTAKRATGNAAPVRTTRIEVAIMSSSRVIPVQEDFSRLAVALIGDAPLGAKKDTGPECHQWTEPRGRLDPSKGTENPGGSRYKTS